MKFKEILAIIPARGGSKGIIKKNIKLLLGKPLIEYTIEAAKKSKFINKIMVTTDDNEIREIALKSGAEVPFLRPDYLATDTSKIIDTCLYVLEKYKELNYLPDIVVLLQPTSPLRNSIHIDEAINILLKESADAVISVTECKHPSKTLRIDKENRLKPFFNQTYSFENRQSIDKVYCINGAIYICIIGLLLEQKTFFHENTYPYIMLLKDSIDIDTIFDFELAEKLLK